MMTKEYFLELYRKRSFFHYFFPLAAYVLYFAATGVFLLMFIGLLIPVLLFSSLRKFLLGNFVNYFTYFLTRIYLPLLGIYKVVEDTTFVPVHCGKPVIFVANHRSQLDGPFVMARLRNTGVIMKSLYMRNPLFSLLVKCSNFVSVNPSSLDSLSVAMVRCKEMIARGENLLIFPEGSRSRSARMLQFKDIAFRLSIEANVPVVPVIVHTDYPLMAKFPDSIFPPEKIKLTVRALSELYAEKGERPSAFANRVRKIMSDQIHALDKNTYWEHL
jgi:1-acyl-sn-glycerol-3-phosphate acyltransferase